MLFVFRTRKFSFACIVVYYIGHKRLVCVQRIYTFCAHFVSVFAVLIVILLNCIKQGERRVGVRRIYTFCVRFVFVFAVFIIVLSNYIGHSKSRVDIQHI